MFYLTLYHNTLQWIIFRCFLRDHGRGKLYHRRNNIFNQTVNQKSITPYVQYQVRSAGALGWRLRLRECAGQRGVMLTRARPDSAAAFIRSKKKKRLKIRLACKVLYFPVKRVVFIQIQDALYIGKGFFVFYTPTYLWNQKYYVQKVSVQFLIKSRFRINISFI